MVRSFRSGFLHIQMCIRDRDTEAMCLCFPELFFRGFLPGLGLPCPARWLPVLIGKPEVTRQLCGGFLFPSPYRAATKSITSPSAPHPKPVSYTHLDVYKRQVIARPFAWRGSRLLSASCQHGPRSTLCTAAGLFLRRPPCLCLFGISLLPYSSVVGRH